MALSVEASADAHGVPVAWLALSLAPTPLTGGLPALLALNGSVALDRRTRVELVTVWCGSWRSVALSRAATFVSRRPPAPSRFAPPDAAVVQPPARTFPNASD